MYKPTFHDELEHCITNRIGFVYGLWNIMPFYCTAWEILVGGIDYINILTLYTTTQTLLALTHTNTTACTHTRIERNNCAKFPYGGS